MQSLDMSGNSFTGAVPPSWTNLKALQRAILHNNSLDGALPPVLPPALTVLSIADNRLVGSLPGVHSAPRPRGALPSATPAWSLLPLGAGAQAPEAGRVPLRCESPPLAPACQPGSTVLPAGVHACATFQTQHSVMALPLSVTALRVSAASAGATLTRALTRAGLPPQLQVLSLRHNSLEGSLGDSLCKVPGLQTLDLGMNKFSGELGQAQSSPCRSGRVRGRVCSPGDPMRALVRRSLM